MLIWKIKFGLSRSRKDVPETKLTRVKLSQADENHKKPWKKPLKSAPDVYPETGHQAGSMVLRNKRPKTTCKLNKPRQDLDEHNKT